MGEEYQMFVPKSNTRKYNVMRFNSGDKVDIKKWTKASLSRDLSAKKQFEDEVNFPEFGEGSEFGKKRREEAKRLKYGKKKSDFKISDQPWNLSVSSFQVPMDDKKMDVKPKLVQKSYHGKKEGGIGEGSMYFVLMQRPDHTFEAHPVKDWCNFTRKISHRTLTDEEAEAAWGKRDKIVNHLNFMARKRLHMETDDGGADDVSGAKPLVRKKGDLVIHDDFDDVGIMSDDDDDDVSKKSVRKRIKKEKEEESEAKEDSDDGEREGVEIAYESDVSSDNEEGIDERVAPKGLDELDDSSSSDEEDAKIEEKLAGIRDESSGVSDLEGIEADENLAKSALLQVKNKSKKDSGGAGGATKTTDKKGSSTSLQSTKPSTTSTSSGNKTTKLGKRTLDSPVKNNKRQKPNPSSTSSATASTSASTTASSKDTSSPANVITPEAVRRVLTHKPITIPKLLKKFRSTGIHKSVIGEHIAGILRTMSLQKTSINGKMYLYLKN